MMGYQEPPQDKLFYTNICLEKRIRADHPLRKTAELIDFDFVYKEVADTYGNNGHVSVPPPVILKLMLLLVFYNVRSERELMDTLPERLDRLWFLGFDLDSDFPNHSVLSKARKRWGAEVFKNFFERIVLQCAQAGLVDGSKIFVDSSLIDANASNNSVVDMQSLKFRLHKNYRELERRLEESHENSEPTRDYREANKRYISSTDPEAAIVRRGRPKLTYQIHRAVDEQHEIITATDATPGDINEAHLLPDLLKQHHDHTDRVAKTVVADKKYGTIENFLSCHDQGVAAHMPDLGQAAKKRHSKHNLFGEDKFHYDQEKDIYICPADQKMKRKAYHTKRQSVDYAAPKKICAACELRDQCTRNKSGRTIKRHLRQDALDHMRQASRSTKAKRDIKTRHHLMERSFARSSRYGFDRARWRGLEGMKIQEYLVCTIQNIQALLNFGTKPKSCPAMALGKIKTVISKNFASFPLIFSPIFGLSGILRESNPWDLACSY